MQFVYKPAEVCRPNEELAMGGLALAKWTVIVVALMFATMVIAIIAGQTKAPVFMALCVLGMGLALYTRSWILKLSHELKDARAFLRKRAWYLIDTLHFTVCELPGDSRFTPRINPFILEDGDVCEMKEGDTTIRFKVWFTDARISKIKIEQLLNWVRAFPNPSKDFSAANQYFAEPTRHEGFVVEMLSPTNKGSDKNPLISSGGGVLKAS